MYKKNIWKKSFTVGIIILFIGVSTISTAKNIEIKNDTFKTTNIQSILNPSYTLTGDWGENNWYISCVTLKFNWIPGEIKELVYKIDDGSFQTYSSPIEICKDGISRISWKWYDHDDNEFIEPAFFIKIDKTPPGINLQKKIDSETQITFIANINDPASGPDRVEFYVDDEYIETDNESPFEYDWEGTGDDHIIKAIVFDVAGHSASAEEDTKPRARNYIFRDLFLSQPLRNLLDIILLTQKILLGYF